MDPESDVDVFLYTQPQGDLYAAPPEAPDGSDGFDREPPDACGVADPPCLTSRTGVSIPEQAAERVSEPTDEQADALIERLDRLPPLPRIRYRKGRGPRGGKRTFWCPPGGGVYGCVPAWLASQYHRLPWTYHVTLTAPPGRFADAWNAWAGLDEWPSLGDPLRPERQPFYLYTLASHPPDGLVHAHILVGGLTYDLVEHASCRWPFRRQVDRITMKRGGPWGVLHYILSQVEPFPGRRAPWKAKHRADHRSYCHNLLRPPGQSPNFELILAMHRYRLALERARRESAPRFSVAGQRGGRSRSSRMTPEQRSAHGRMMARALWDGRRLIDAWQRKRKMNSAAVGGKE